MPDDYYFYHYDMRGSTTAIVMPDGSLITGYTYDEFGNLERSGDAGFLNETTFTGSVTDTSTGLQYMNARYYNPQTGRFISQDTYSGNAYDPWTQHLYAYCGNNPVNMIDPTGHVPRFDKPKEYKYNKSDNRDNVISAPTRNGDTESDAETEETPSWLQSIFDFFLGLIDDIFGTDFGAASTVVQAIKYGYSADLASKAIDESILNHYLNIITLGGADARGEDISGMSILPVIWPAGWTVERYKDHCVKVYGGGVVYGHYPYDSNLTNINEINGVLGFTGEDDYLRFLQVKTIKDCLQFPLSTAAGMLTDGVGSILVDAVFDSTDIYQILK